MVRYRTYILACNEHSLGRLPLHRLGGLSFCDGAAVVSSVKVYYGGKSGRGQRIDIEVVTPEITFMFNIRDTTGKGKGWPDKLQSGYKFKGEDVFTCAWDVDEDASAGSVQRSSSGKKVSGGTAVKQGDLHG